MLASAQFLMTLDSSVMNVSMAKVAADLGTSITGIQVAITLYTLVMATLMVTGGKVGSILGRKRAFAIGTAIYAAGSLTTAIAPNIPVLLFGWALLEGIGAALIMPAIVALVASNFAPARRPAAYGMVAASAAVAVAAGPLIGGAVSTYASWRYVFVGEVVIAAVILARIRRLADPPAEPGRRLDIPGAVLTILGLGAIVFGVLRSSEWGWVTPARGGPSLLGLSPVVLLLTVGGLLVWAFVEWERHVAARGREPLIDVTMFASRRLVGGLAMFGAQTMVQAGVFFALPLFLALVLELDPLATGVHLLPLSLALLASAIGVPRLFAGGSPRRIVQVGLGLILVGILMLMAGMDPGAGAGVVAIPLLLQGLGLGTLASQLGAVTVSGAPQSQSAEVGGLQNTATNLGASLGTALIGSVLIATLATSVIGGIRDDPRVPQSVKDRVDTELTGSVTFVSDTTLKQALTKANVAPEVADAVVEANTTARLDALRVAFALAALLAVAALFVTRLLPDEPVADVDPPAYPEPAPAA